MNLDQNMYNLDVPVSDYNSLDNNSQSIEGEEKYKNSDNKQKSNKFSKSKINKLNYKRRIANRGFKLIDKRFRQQVSLLPGIITQAKPIAGKVIVDVNFQGEIFEKAMKMVLDRWSLSVGYQELRSLKGLNGLPGSTSDNECLLYTAKALTVCMGTLTNLIYTQENFGVYLQQIGLGKLIMPKLFLDVMKMLISYKRLHHPNFLEACSILFNIGEYNILFDEDYDLLKVRYDKIFKNFKEFNAPFYEIYNYLSRFTQLTSIMKTDITDCYELSVSSSAHVFNVLNEFDDEGNSLLKVGQNITENDILLSMILSVKVVKTDLSEYHLDYYFYRIPKNQYVVGLKRAILSGYCNIDDMFVSPTTTALATDVNEAEVGSITDV